MQFLTFKFFCSFAQKSGGVFFAKNPFIIFLMKWLAFNGKLNMAKVRKPTFLKEKIGIAKNTAAQKSLNHYFSKIFY